MHAQHICKRTAHADIQMLDVKLLIVSKVTNFKVNHMGTGTKTFAANLIPHKITIIQLNMDILGKQTKAKWLKLKLSRVRRKPYASSLSMNLSMPAE